MLYIGVFPKGLFTLSDIVYSCIDASIDAWEEYLVSIISFTLIISISIKTSVKIQIGPGMIEKTSLAVLTLGVNMA